MGQRIALFLVLAQIHQRMQAIEEIGAEPGELDEQTVVHLKAMGYIE